MIKSLCCALLCLTMLLAGTWTAAQENPPLFKGYTSIVRIDPPLSPFEPDTPITFLGKLQINKSLKFRSAVRKNEDQGVLDLRRLCLNASVEEHWAYLPEENLWYDISFGETPGSATIDFAFLEKLIKNHRQIAIYHIHLRNYLKQVKKGQNIEVPETWLVVPSFPDIALMIYFNGIFNRYHPTGNISWNVCSPLGKTRYGLSVTGKAQYKKIEGGIFFLTYFYPDSSAPIDSKSVATFDFTAPHDIGDLIKWANEQGQGHIEVAFFPYPTQIHANGATSE